MKKVIIILITIAFASSVFAQSTKSVDIKNSSDDTLLEIYDESGNGGSIYFPNVGSVTNYNAKLYNWGGNLFWGNQQLGTAGSAGGWTDAGSIVRLQTATDKVGIGTSSPTANVQIEGSSNIPVAIVGNTSAFDGSDTNLSNLGALVLNSALIAGTGHQVSIVATGKDVGNYPSDILFWTRAGSDPVERMRINYEGKVGIGTTDPDELLHVWGDMRLKGAFEDKDGEAGTTGQILSSTSSGTNWINLQTSGWEDSGTIVQLTTSTDKVGIGTGFPDAPLEVQYNTGTDGIIIDGPTDGWSTLYFKENGLNKAYLGWYGASDYFTIRSLVGSVEINLTDDKVGIDILSPTEKLDVAGNIKASGNVYGSGGNSIDWNTAYSWGNHGSAGYLSGSGLTTSYIPKWNGTQMVNSLVSDDGSEVHVHGFLKIDNYAAGPGLDMINVSNVVGIVISSERYKYDIQPMSIVPEEVLQLNPVTFKYKENHIEDYGLIAEAVSEQIPDLVIYDEEGRPESVRYSRLAIFLLEVVKEQQKQIDELKQLIGG